MLFEKHIDEYRDKVKNLRDIRKVIVSNLVHQPLERATSNASYVSNKSPSSAEECPVAFESERDGPSIGNLPFESLRPSLIH